MEKLDKVLDKRRLALGVVHDEALKKPPAAPTPAPISAPTVPPASGTPPVPAPPAVASPGSAATTPPQPPPTPNAAAVTLADSILNQVLQQYVNGTSSNGLARMATVTQGYQLAQLLTDKSKANGIIFEEAIVGGGSQRDRKNLISNLFWGDFISYSGGAVIVFNVLDPTKGIVASAKTYRYLTPHTRIKKPIDIKAADTKSGSNF